MAVFAFHRRHTLEPGIYPFEPHRHLRQVAELVGEVFAGELDAEGRGLVREMHTIGRLSPFLGGVLSASLLGEFVGGFVWMEDGRVLGNLTLQRLDWGGVRWRISNVAVAATHRGRGIGRSLMLAGLSEIAQMGGSWAILQVRIDNVPARRLYESLGFTAVCQDGIWKLATRPSYVPAADVSLQPLAASAWRPRFELARAAQSEPAAWLAPVVAEAYQVGLWQAAGERLGAWLGVYRVQRWGAYAHGLLAGMVEVWANAFDDVYRLRLAVRPAARGRLEHALIAQALRALTDQPPAPVVIEHSGDHREAVAALEAFGFQPQRVLLTMRRPISPEDALL
ncbi:MAG: GNAT family N-acetyltransferase [Anaerolineae bacterium]|nr:GNAT family N-acetyltransferase [Anaerolineae bacterium]